MAITNNEGKTWEKIDKNGTAFQRNNFKNNDYIDTNKKIKYEFKSNEQGNVDCRNNKLITLKGAPQKVDGYFDCSDNKLTTLEGAPQEIGRDFNCAYNNLTTLEGAPQKVSGYFDCAYNNLTTLEGAPQKVSGYFNCRMNKKLPKEEIIKYLKLAKISGKIYTSYGDFENQEEALKKLTAIKHFSY